MLPIDPLIASLSKEAPDWASITDEVLCPLCEYNLRGLTTPRCPECGYHFEWPEVLDPRRRNHPYLFEHHAQRNVRSFCQTAVGACRPRRFWATLHPVQRSHPWRLLLYWCLGTLCWLPTTLTPIIVAASIRANANINTRSREAANIKTNGMEKYIIRQFGSVNAYLNSNWPSVTTVDALKAMVNSQQANAVYLRLIFPMLVLAPLLWAWTTFAALMIFQISMRRARVKSIHVLRCTLYSFDLLPLAGIILIGSLFMGLFLSDPQYFVPALLLMLMLNVAIGIWRLRASYKYYLRFHQPSATVFSAQVIVFLLILVISFTFGPRFTYDNLHLLFRLFY